MLVCLRNKAHVLLTVQALGLHVHALEGWAMDVGFSLVGIYDLHSMEMIVVGILNFDTLLVHSLSNVVSSKLLLYCPRAVSTITNDKISEVDYHVDANAC